MGGVILEEIGDRVWKCQGDTVSVMKGARGQDMIVKSVSQKEHLGPREVVKKMVVREVSVAQTEPGDQHILSA